MYEAVMLLRHEGFRRLCEARDALREVGERTPSIRAVARRVRMSRAHFIRQFEAVFGVTPHQYRMQARIELAKRLLATSSLTVTDICMEVGCSSLGSFSALFRREVGESPSAYRRRAQALSSAMLTPGCLSVMQNLPAREHVDANRTFREA
jgi:AraC-like DNA-binding protein